MFEGLGECVMSSDKSYVLCLIQNNHMIFLQEINTVSIYKCLGTRFSMSCTLKEETFAGRNFRGKKNREIFTFCGHKLSRVKSYEKFCGNKLSR